MESAKACLSVRHTCRHFRYTSEPYRRTTREFRAASRYKRTTVLASALVKVLASVLPTELVSESRTGSGLGCLTALLLVSVLLT
jgi:hypothetical protein